MNYIVSTLILFFLLRVDGVPSGFRILSNRKAYVHEYPFIVKLERQVIISGISDVDAADSVHICTGTALSTTLTLTAGHCIDSTNPSKVLTNNLRIKCVIRYGIAGTETVDLMSTIRHPSYKDRPRSFQNDIGLLRTTAMRLNQFGTLSPLDINMVGGQEISFVGYESFYENSSLIAPSRRQISYPKKVLRAKIIRSDTRNATTVPGVCVIRRCVPSSVQVCPEASGSPMLHASGIVGINTWD
ncbi:trypsin beta-like [Trichoplusia ni]|uniref:Trypsin beta-like n=1 Tax=Trichoplusia ni TaxID=7111 RepID=A0A7E5WNV7_TRINI|nr:trypsin beta-like [Trichoplusia ni]